MGYFFDLTEISGRNFGRKFPKSAKWKFVAKLIPTFRGFEFEVKTKKLEGFKVRECKIFENRFYPPPLKMKGPNSIEISRHDQKKKLFHFLKYFLWDTDKLNSKIQYFECAWHTQVSETWIQFICLTKKMFQKCK